MYESSPASLREQQCSSLSIKCRAITALVTICSILQISTTVAQERIVGGHNVVFDQVQSTVALISNSRYAETGDYAISHFCGGTVIAPRWILTAAHCVRSEDGITTAETDLSVLVGSPDLRQPVQQAIAVNRVIPHPSYTDAVDGFDIALLALASDAPVTKAIVDVTPVTLNDSAYVTGWGLLAEPVQGETNFKSSNLLGAFIAMIPGERCVDYSQLIGSVVTDSQLCAGVPAGGVDTCQGDSGGPLYSVYGEGVNLELKLRGITSWGIGCAQPDSPGVYTLVSHYVSWIRNQTLDPTVGTTEATNPDITPTAPADDSDSSDGPLLAVAAVAGAAAIGAAATGSWQLLLALTILVWLRAIRKRNSGRLYH